MIRLFSLMNEWSEILEFGATPPVDSFPLLKLIPESIFGMWKSRAIQVERLMTALYTQVLGQVKERRENGLNRGSFMDRVLDQNKEYPLTPNQLYFLGGVLMEGGSDTSSSLILAMVRAMIEFPEVQKKCVWLFPGGLLHYSSHFSTGLRLKSTPTSARRDLRHGPTSPIFLTST